MPRLTDRVRRTGRAVRWCAAAAAVALLLAPDLSAYYDDVHYALTYYIARQSGFTPLQAYRIASANVSVDYDPNTEPVQPTAQKLQLIGLKEAAQTPRWKFHAFRNELEYPGTAGRGVNAEAAAKIGDADLAIRMQQDDLWNRSLTFMHFNGPIDGRSYGGNPGVFLHFFMDREPHAKYGSAWGHWPLDPEYFPNAINDKLPIGGTTDWVGFRPNDVATLVEQTAGWLGQFMQKVSPLQPFRPYQQSDYTQLLRQLAAPFPAPIDSPLKRELYARFFGMELPFGNIPASRDAPVIADLASDLKGEPPANFEKQKSGPDKSAANTAVNAALRNAGMDDSIPMGHYAYPLATNGDLWPSEPEQLDKWVLVGLLKVRVIDNKDGARVPFDGGTVTVKLAKLRRNGPEVILGQPKSIGRGATIEFDTLPVGDLVVEVRDTNGGGRGRVEVTLDRRELELEVLLPPAAAPTTTTYKPVPDVCALFPDESPVDKKKGAQNPSSSRCNEFGPFASADTWYADIIQDVSPERAASTFGPMNTGGEQPSAEFGTQAWVLRTSDSINIKFLQGVFTVRIDGKGKWKEPWERMAHQVDATLKSVMARSGAAPAGTAPAAPAGAPPIATATTTPIPTPLPGPAAPPPGSRSGAVAPPPPTTRPVPPPTAAPPPVAPPPAATGTATCAQIRQQRESIEDNVRSLMTQIRETTLEVRANALRRRLAELVQQDQALEQQELARCR